ncbi:MAG TPA: sigma-70 family RNA polymerase sigma factor [Pseudonocardia sp.]|nr:sigma-70 family RNA polymerase sigma factor [Pseudonocardia sp.]
MSELPAVAPGPGSIHRPASGPDDEDPACGPGADGTACGPGDEEARSAAFRRYVEPELPVLYRVALALAGQHADAEDLVQDTLIRAYRAVDRFDGEHPRAWLLTILRNTHRNRLRTRLPALLQDGDDDAGLLDRAGEGRSAEDVVVDAQFEAVVADALTTLPTAHRVVVQLVDVDGLSYAEAADALGVPRGTVMSRLHRARARIRTRLVDAGLVPRRRRS